MPACQYNANAAFIGNQSMSMVATSLGWAGWIHPYTKYVSDRGFGTTTVLTRLCCDRSPTFTSSQKRKKTSRKSLIHNFEMSANFKFTFSVKHGQPLHL